MSLQEPELRMKRSRVPNFSAHEKSILVRLISKRKHIIESKLTDGKTIAQKKNAWLLVEREFNAEPHVYKRELLVLKRAWDNLKSVTRKLRAQQRGLIKSEKPSPEVPPSPRQEDIPNMVEEVLSPSEVDNNSDSNEVSIEKTPIFLEQSCNKTVNSSILAPQVIVCEPYSLAQTEALKTSDANDRRIPSSHSKRANQYVQREAALRLRSLQFKSKLENQILKTKLKTALLQQQEAEVRLDAAKLELEIKRNLIEL